MKRIIYIATDGSYTEKTNPKEVFGGVVIKEGEQYIHKITVKSTDAGLVSGHNVGGEVLAAIVGMGLGVQHVLDNIPTTDEVTIHFLHDYEGIGNWVRGIWKAKLPYTQGYVHTMWKLPAGISNLTIDFQWVRGHATTTLNIMADELAGAYDQAIDVTSYVNSLLYGKQ